MSSMVKGSALRMLEYGTQVLKPAQALPQTGTASLYVVTGGQVVVTSLMGRVSTVIQNQACTLSIGAYPAVGTISSANGIATAGSITNLEVGSLIGVAAASGTAGILTVGANAGKAVYLPNPFIVNSGTISVVTNASNTGKIDWELTYVPLDTGASVT